MTFNWRDFLTFAENIEPASSNVGPREAALRSAVSRAYYAAFQASMEFGKQDGYVPTGTGEDHFKIRKHFRESKPTHERKKKISIELDRLYDLRRKADYENALKTSPENMANFALGMARSVFSYIGELSG